MSASITWHCIFRFPPFFWSDSRASCRPTHRAIWGKTWHVRLIFPRKKSFYNKSTSYGTRLVCLGIWTELDTRIRSLYHRAIMVNSSGFCIIFEDPCLFSATFSEECDRSSPMCEYCYILIKVYMQCIYSPTWSFHDRNSRPSAWRGRCCTALNIFTFILPQSTAPLVQRRTSNFMNIDVNSMSVPGLREKVDGTRSWFEQ